ncbi:HIT domain-containing protein [Paenibacillus timonensis]|nr:HIT domain-containing protein [Paenibacillus timonensis]MUG86515.1 HIT domain-containing protein [Paenibacillus timonensis]
MEECIFCRITDNSPQEILFSNDFCLYTVLKDPEIEGAGLIVPRNHRETVFDLSEEEWNATHQMLHTVKEYIDVRYHPDGYNIGWNCGAVGGQHIFHAHLHVIPRFRDEPMAGKGIRYLFKSQWNKRS